MNKKRSDESNMIERLEGLKTRTKRRRREVDEEACKNYFGYKLHASIDKRHKLVRKVIIINTAFSDSLVFEELLDPNNTSRDIYADCGYPSAEREAALTADGWRLQNQRKGSANKPNWCAPWESCAHLRVAPQNCELQLAATRLFERARPQNVLKRVSEQSPEQTRPHGTFPETHQARQIDKISSEIERESHTNLTYHLTTKKCGYPTCLNERILAGIAIGKHFLKLGSNC
jgi:hypothetical protein